MVGGEEFAWILPETDGIQALEARRAALDATPDVPSDELSPAASRAASGGDEPTTASGGAEG